MLAALKTKEPDFDVRHFVKLRDFIYRRTGIYFEEKKLYFVKKRVLAEMARHGFKDFDSYFRALRFRDEELLQSLINALTTNETYFFREFDQLAVFAEECLPLVCEEKEKRGVKRLRLWSAGCSTGEEPYTLAIILLEMIDDLPSWDAKIEATDIDTAALEKARRGVYGLRSVKNVPEEYFRKYFRPQGKNLFQVTEEVKSLVRFSHLNLFDDQKMSQMKGFDFIFCRNVLIYFDERSRRRVVEHFYRALLPGGFIFLGHSESLSRITNAFKIVRMGGMIVYQKPKEAEA